MFFIKIRNNNLLHECKAGIRYSSHPSKEVQKSPRVGRGKKSGLGRHPRPLARRDETLATRRQVRSRGKLHPGQGIKRAVAEASPGADARVSCRPDRQGARGTDCQPHQRIVGRAWRDDPGEGIRRRRESRPPCRADGRRSPHQ